MLCFSSFLVRPTPYFGKSIARLLHYVYKIPVRTWKYPSKNKSSAMGMSAEDWNHVTGNHRAQRIPQKQLLPIPWKCSTTNRELQHTVCAVSQQDSHSLHTKSKACSAPCCLSQQTPTASVIIIKATIMGSWAWRGKQTFFSKWENPTINRLRSWCWKVLSNIQNF